jgi:hypothetical protein
MPPCRLKCTKTEKNRRFPKLFGLQTAKNTVFRLKVLNKIYVFKEYISFKIFCYFRHCGVIPVQSFGSHIRPPATWISDKGLPVSRVTKGFKVVCVTDIRRG